MRVPAILYRPEMPRAMAPAIIAVNGYGGDKFSWYAMYTGILYVAEIRKSRESVFDAMFNPGAGHRPYFLTKIEAMPVSHISEWAKAHSIEMDPQYATGHREGGTPALGTGVPGIKRSALQVYSDKEWTARLDLLVHESWRRRVKEQMENGASK